MIIEILFILWLILVLKDRKYLPPRNAVFWSLSGLAGVFVLTTFTSVDPAKSFLGTMERGSGVFTWLHYFIFFIITASAFKYIKEWFNLFNWSVAVSLVVSLYALAQRLGLQSVYESGVDRATGTIGNAAFLASYLILSIGLALVLLFSKENFSRKNLSYRIFCYSALFLNLAAVYLSGTRGAVLGILAGFFFFVLFFVFFGLTGRSTKKYLAAALLFVVIFSGLLWGFRDSVVVKKIPGLSRLATISLSDATARTRILAWQISWRAWEEKFFTGWGPDNFNIAFNKYFNEEFYKYGRGETWFDRAHNVIFDIGTTSGALGVAAYLAVFFAALRILWRHRKKDFLVALSLASVLIAYFAQNLLVFDVFNSFLLFFLILAFVSFMKEGFVLPENKNAAGDLKESKGKKISRKQGSLGAGAITALAILIFSFFLIFWQYNYKVLAADFWSAQAFKNANQPQAKTYLADKQKADSAFNKIFGLYEKTFSYQTCGDPEMRVDFVGFVFDNSDNRNISQAAREKVFSFALEQSEQNIASHPLNARWYLLEAKLLQGYAQLKKEAGQENDSFLEESQKTILQGIDLSPRKVAMQYVLIQTLIMREKYAEALEKAQAAVYLYPEFPDSQWYLALAYIGMEDETSALKAIDTAFDYGYSFQNMGDLKLAIALLSKYNDLSGLEKGYLEAIRFEPRNLQWYASLATVYSQLGQKDRAIETANKIIDIDPDSRPDVEQFIKGL